jgi:hypothetical protein
VQNCDFYKRNKTTTLKAKRVSPILPICLFIICVLSLTNLVISNLLSTKGIEFGQVSSKLSQVQSENRRLSLNLSQLESLSQIKQKAESLGFVSISSTLTINTTTSTFASKM